MPSYSDEKHSISEKLIVAGIGVGILFIIAILALIIATFVQVNNNKITATTTMTYSLNSILAESIRIQDVMNHLKQLQRIATANNGTRAVSTPGFNQTLDYITNILAINTDYNVNKTFFPIRQFAMGSNPILISSINGISKNYTYSTTLSVADFYYIQFSTKANFTNFIGLTAIPNVGCTDNDWQTANPSPVGRVALVKRGTCPFVDKGVLAARYNVTGLLIYNDGGAPERVPPIAIGLGQENNLSALFLSYPVGQELANAAQNMSTNASVQLIIDALDLPLSPIGNICADTPTGDATQTIVIGSHSDSVPAGPGINDNGKLLPRIFYLCLSYFRKW
jgi:aminopeptidase Y